MSDPREIMERIARSAPSPTEGFEGVRERRRRREARRRATAFVAAFLITVPSAWWVISAFGGRLAPMYATIGSDNVSRLRVVWQSKTGGLSGSSLTTDPSTVYVGTTSGDLIALDPADGSELWTARLDGFVTSNPVAVNGRVYAHTSRGTLYAFPSSCKTPCVPTWTAHTGSGTSTPPTVGEGSVFAVSTQGRLLSFPVDCAGSVGVCQPSWVAHSGQHLPIQVAVANGVVWDSSSTRLIPFSAACDSGVADCQALTDGFRPHWALSSAPAVAGGAVYVGGSDGSVYAIPTACAGDAARCQPLWVGKTGGAIVSTPVVAGGVVYVGSNDGNVYAYPALCRTDGAKCDPSWFGRPMSPISASPTVTGDVVFVTSGADVFAFSAFASSQGEQTPLVRKTFGGRTLMSAVWTGRVLLVEERSGIIFALAERAT